LAPGTQWSQKPIESLPAAFAVRTNGAAIIVADAAAVVATKRRRLILVFFMGTSSCCSRFRCLGARDRPSRAKDASRRLCARLIS
jgi:hypothetical protein